MKSTGLTSLRCRCAAADGLLGRYKPFDANILPHGGAGGVLEQSAELRNTQEGPFAERLERQIFKQMLIDVVDDVLR